MAGQTFTPPVGQGFVERLSGVSTGGDAAQGVRAQKGTPERVYVGLSKQMRVTNRAKKGAMKGKPWMWVYGGEAYPEDADRSDPPDQSTWLQPGESMVVPREVAIHIFGAIFAPGLPDKLDILSKHGGWEYMPTPSAGLPGRMPPMQIVGPPPRMADLLVQQIDGKGKAVGPELSLLETYKFLLQPSQYAKIPDDGRRRDERVCEDAMEFAAATG